jgi:hypothetical protein
MQRNHTPKDSQGQNDLLVGVQIQEADNTQKTQRIRRVRKKNNYYDEYIFTT